ncbi:uncharacterized protein [Neodiprion pinetum]|uniref:uncharacterized protein isoform X1 n=1 Tax=Neodiprion pinetum TaxID=441929 RepID=UPI001EDCF850|nr:uncharacterized protein LOC124219799 isoform X1 [Neodiprion pinetum]XP_046483883.1 uncharacterized protein LOC124219799 isoform X1 [Neodiprion pinetum]
MSLMTIIIIGVFLVILASLEAVTVIDHHPDEEYYIEHQVSYKDAVEEAKKLKIYPVGMDAKGPIPGCKTCSADEMEYCSNEGVVNDHCCCDTGPEDDSFRFMPHVCRIGPEVCQVQAADCAEYTRIRECCCHAYHAEKWKNIASGSSRSARSDYFSFMNLIALFTASGRIFPILTLTR